jgi:uncharacterized protein
MASAIAQGPSFNCARATSAADRAICSDAGLAAKDKQYVDMFERLQTETKRLAALTRATPQALEQELRGQNDQAMRLWQERIACQQDKNCIRNNYEKGLRLFSIQLKQVSDYVAARSGTRQDTERPTPNSSVTNRPTTDPRVACRWYPYALKRDRSNYLELRRLASWRKKVSDLSFEELKSIGYADYVSLESTLQHDADIGRWQQRNPSIGPSQSPARNPRATPQSAQPADDEVSSLEFETLRSIYRFKEYAGAHADVSRFIASREFAGFVAEAEKGNPQAAEFAVRLIFTRSVPAYSVQQIGQLKAALQHLIVDCQRDFRFSRLLLALGLRETPAITLANIKAYHDDLMATSHDSTAKAHAIGLLAAAYLHTGDHQKAWYYAERTQSEYGAYVRGLMTTGRLVPKEVADRNLDGFGRLDSFPEAMVFLLKRGAGPRCVYLIRAIVYFGLTNDAAFQSCVQSTDLTTESINIMVRGLREWMGAPGTQPTSVSIQQLAMLQLAGLRADQRQRESDAERAKAEKEYDCRAFYVTMEILYQMDGAAVLLATQSMIAGLDGAVDNSALDEKKPRAKRVAERNFMVGRLNAFLANRESYPRTRATFVSNCMSATQ